jgi:lysophospholipase L1-like esterase
MADRVYGEFLMPEIRSFVYPPYSQVYHASAEFEVNIATNNLGFRGNKTSIKKNRKRVLVIGDSFTFGWGVANNETWVAKLQEAYPTIEFLNLGQGGSHQGDHVQTLRRAILELKPDVVIACILQGNDLQQLYKIVESRENKLRTTINTSSIPSLLCEASRRLASTLYPNFTTRFGKSAEIKSRWLAESNSIVENLSEEEMVSFKQLDPELIESFKDGLINPSLVINGLKYPDHYRTVSDTSDITTQKAIQYMHALLLQMAELCTMNQSALMVVAQPCRPYGFSESIEPLKKAGYSVSGCDTLNALLPIEMAISNTKIPLLAPSLPDDYNRLFYYYDGHWNAEGNRIFAMELINALDKDSLWKRFLTSSSF